MLIKIQVKGKARQVQPFLYDLEQRPQFELHHKEVLNQEITLEDEVTVKCHIRHQPDRRVKVVQMVTAEGAEIHIPMMDLIQTEIEDGVHVFTGRIFDVFS